MHSNRSTLINTFSTILIGHNRSLNFALTDSMLEIRACISIHIHDIYIARSFYYRRIWRILYIKDYLKRILVTIEK